MATPTTTRRYLHVRPLSGKGPDIDLTSCCVPDALPLPEKYLVHVDFTPVQAAMLIAAEAIHRTGSMEWHKDLGDLSSSVFSTVEKTGDGVTQRRTQPAGGKLGDASYGGHDLGDGRTLEERFASARRAARSDPK